MCAAIIYRCLRYNALSYFFNSSTTWVHKILHSLLHVYDDDGNVIPGSNDEKSIGAGGQVYPDALPLNRQEMAKSLEKDDASTKMVKQTFGNFTFEELCQQPTPRLISTHLFGMDLLPKELLGSEESKETNDKDDGMGRLIIVLRNLKDALCSLHFFYGEAKDGWLGNSLGPGSFNRFVSDECPNAFGSSFDWISEQQKVINFLQNKVAANAGKNRVLVVYYEAMKANLPAQIDRINSFLDLKPLTTQKKMSVAQACGFNAMKTGSAGKMANIIMRKGSIGDWHNHINKEVWDKFDTIFARKLGNVDIAKPLHHFQWWDIPGMPPTNRKEWTLDTDPRMWPVFERVCLEEGMVVPDKIISKNKQGQFKRTPSEFVGTIPSDKYEAETGRYHLFISGVCPWASSTAVSRHLLGLEDVISMDIADGQSGAGWVFLDGASVEPWKDRPGKPFWIHEAYQLHDSLVTTRITVPVLWDKKTKTIVSNDSWSIIKMMSNAFAGMGNPPEKAAELMVVDTSGQVSLVPAGMEKLIDSKRSSIYNPLLNGVYKAGLGLMMNNEVENEAVTVARKGVYDKLSDMDNLLSHQRFMLGENLTAPDISLAMNLFRWDCSYREAFKLKGGRGGILLGDGYPNLKAYLRDLYIVMEPLIDFRAIRQYYRIRQAIQSKGEDYVQENKEDLSTLPDLNEITASAKEPTGGRPS